MKFRSDVNVCITGIWFYMASTNTGARVENLWMSTGTLLATATFTGESASGWQQVLFSSPVPITANTVYVVSYHANNGHYSASPNYFATSGVDSPPLHVAVNGGVYAYGSTSNFPTQTFNATNYWVDVVFSPGSLPPPSSIAVTSVSLPSGNPNVAFTAMLAASGGITPYTWSITSGALPAGLSLTSGTGAISGTPTATGTFSFTVRVTDANGQSVTKPLSIIIANVVTNTVVSLWPGPAVPGVVDEGPDSPVELGVKFRSDVNGSITGIRFYKASTNTGTHVANLWTSSGTLLATATFTGETASGWQQVLFSSPVPITANMVYVASYHALNGHYSDDPNNFATTGVDSPPLHALANGVSGGNGVYAYGSSSLFPTQTWVTSNYWVNVMFQP